MTYFCFIETTLQTVPHMEPLTASTPDEAKAEANALLEQHDSGTVAHIWLDEERIASIYAPESEQERRQA